MGHLFNTWKQPFFPRHELQMTSLLSALGVSWLLPCAVTLYYIYWMMSYWQLLKNIYSCNFPSKCCLCDKVWFMILILKSEQIGSNNHSVGHIYLLFSKIWLALLLTVQTYFFIAKCKLGNPLAVLTCIWTDPILALKAILSMFFPTTIISHCLSVIKMQSFWNMLTWKMNNVSTSSCLIKSMWTRMMFHGHKQHLQVPEHDYIINCFDTGRMKATQWTQDQNLYKKETLSLTIVKSGIGLLLIDDNLDLTFYL